MIPCSSASIFPEILTNSAFIMKSFRRALNIAPFNDSKAKVDKQKMCISPSSPPGKHKCNREEKKQNHACIHKQQLIQLKDTNNMVLIFHSDL